MPPPRLLGPAIRLSARSKHSARRSLSTSRPLAVFTAHSPAVSPPTPPPAGAAKLTHRRLLTIYGPDATHFLQGLVTANVRPGLTAGFYAAFLSAQGRMLSDVFIYPSSHSSAFASMLPESVVAKYGTPGTGTPSYIVEADADEVERLAKHLKRHKLRAKLDIRLLEPEEWSAWSVWDDKSPWTPHSSPTPSSTMTLQDAQETELVAGRPDVIGAQDARAPGMGRRILLSGNQTPASLLETEAAYEAPLSAYTIRRMLRGVAEGQHELPRETALPQESNVDFMAGIDFRKGCYVGQELTIRTHHTGVVRKRVLPVQLFVDEPSPQSLSYTPDVPSVALDVPPAANILPAESKRGRSTGRWLAGVGNIGLALCRVEAMTDLILTAEGSGAAAGLGPPGEQGMEASFVLAPPSAAAADEQGGTGRARMASREPLTDADGRVLRVKAFAPDWLRNRVRPKAANVRV